MNIIKATFQRHAGYVIKYPFTVALLAICCGIVLVTSYYNKTLGQAAGYLAGCWFCCLVTDLVIAVRPAFAPGFPIRKPVRREIITILICTALGFAFLAIRFFTDWNHLPGLVKLSALALIVFTFPIALAAIYLFRYRYKPRELGVNINYWYLPILLHIIWGGLTLWLAPEKSHWRQAWVEYGLWGSLFTGLISAALPEEFVRLLLQTRIGRACNSIAFGLFIASAIWAAMHIPVGYNQTHQPVTFFSASESIAYLVPLGMFWGYLTQRTRSLLPAVLMHGFNLWGLQNF